MKCDYLQFVATVESQSQASVFMKNKYPAIFEKNPEGRLTTKLNGICRTLKHSSNNLDMFAVW